MSPPRTPEDRPLPTPPSKSGPVANTNAAAGLNGGNRWYPTSLQLNSPSGLERSCRQLLSQHYDLQDKFAAMADAHAQLQADHASVKQQLADAQSTIAAANGPATTKLLGLHVAPVDTTTLANGATLKFSKTQGNFIFS